MTRIIGILIAMLISGCVTSKVPKPEYYYVSKFDKVLFPMVVKSYIDMPTYTVLSRSNSLRDSVKTTKYLDIAISPEEYNTTTSLRRRKEIADKECFQQRELVAQQECHAYFFYGDEIRNGTWKERCAPFVASVVFRVGIPLFVEEENLYWIDINEFGLKQLGGHRFKAKRGPNNSFEIVSYQYLGSGIFD